MMNMEETRALTVCARDQGLDLQNKSPEEEIRINLHRI